MNDKTLRDHKDDAALHALEAVARLLEVSESMLEDDPHPGRVRGAEWVHKAQYDVWGALGELAAELGMHSSFMEEKTEEGRRKVEMLRRARFEKQERGEQ